LNERPLTAEQLAELEPYEDTIIANESVDPIQATNLVTIRYRHSDPALAQKIANALAEVFRENNPESSGGFKQGRGSWQQ
jgi:uncharacterized protein involved in exopolysaccharide biosynthesis